MKASKRCNKIEMKGVFYYAFCCCILFSTILMCAACQKVIHLDFDNSVIKQVINANLYPNTNLTVNISKSKRADDYSAVEFLNDCKVDIYENDIFKETLAFVLKDTLSGLGYYTSSFLLQENKTYKIVSTHATLGIAEASEYLPFKPDIINFALLQHADSLQTKKDGHYIIVFQDSADFKEYYFLATFYRVLKPTIDNHGDTIYKYDYIWDIPSHTPLIPNVNNFWPRSYTTDDNFNGQLTSLTVSFPSQYNTNYKEIALIIELSRLGKNFYEWNTQQLRYGIDYLNDGQYDRINIKSNIKNGFGHFSANSSTFIGIPIK